MKWLLCVLWFGEHDDRAELTEQPDVRTNGVGLGWAAVCRRCGRVGGPT